MHDVASHFATRLEHEQVLGFATLLALADRRLALTEQKALLRLGEILGFKRAEVQMVVHKVALRLEAALSVISVAAKPVSERPARETVPAGSRRGEPGEPSTKRSG
jgi:hypothetical protein